MSLLQKFTNLFKSKDELLEVLGQLLKPKGQKEFDAACECFGQLMKRYPAVVFNFLRCKENVENYHPKPEHLLNLLFTIHVNIADDSISAQLRGPPIYWLDKLMTENKESFIIIERMICEASTSSFFPQQSPITQPSQFQCKGDQVKDKRLQKISLNEQLKNPALKTELQLTTSQLKGKIFCIIYYSYLQKLSVNLLVYEASKEMQYPFDEPDDVKLRYIWIYKIQNIMMMALKLLECNNIKYKLYQDLIYSDMVRFQQFIRQEIESLIDHYATIPNLDCLSLFEIFSEYQRANVIIENYCSETDLKLRVTHRQIEEFLSFAVRLKVLNQFTFKKSLKVPNRQQPNISIEKQSERKHYKAVSDVNKENEQLNFNDLHYDQIYERGVMEKKYYNQSTENSFEDDIPQRPVHVKGLSTFHQN